MTRLVKHNMVDQMRCENIPIQADTSRKCLSVRPLIILEFFFLFIVKRCRLYINNGINWVVGLHYELA